MQHHLVNLLLEEYKQQCLFKQLEEKRIYLMDICVENINIVLDIMGFPENKGSMFSVEEGEEGEAPKRVMKLKNDKDFFNRGWLHKPYYTLFDKLSPVHKVTVTMGGLEFVDKTSIDVVRGALLSYVEWLYFELERLQQGGEAGDDETEQ